MKKLIIGILLILTIGCTKNEVKTETKEVFSFLQTNYRKATITEITTYGRYFNIAGYVDDDISELSLVLKNDDLEKEYPLILTKEKNKTSFTTNKLINEGINLEDISLGKYAILLKNKEEYYTFENKSNYNEINYYTISNQSKCNEIKVEFMDIDKDKYLIMNVEQINLKKEIYDIVIDPGHGGIDVGATNGKYHESDITLEYGKLLKKELEKIGLKVILTRDKDIKLDNYGEKGRVSVPYVTKAKMMLSIHLNSAKLNVGNGGVEIYAPSNTNTRFASTLAKNIVDLTGSPYSKNSSSKVTNGVYVRTLSKDDIETMKEEAEEKGYKPYEKATTNSTYYFMIREVGGIITGSYIDGRDKDKLSNPYYNSNMGCESYLLELGYMSSDTNLDLILNKKNDYIKAIVKSVKEEFKL